MRHPTLPVCTLVMALLMMLAWLDSRFGGQRREFGIRIGWRPGARAGESGAVNRSAVRRLAMLLPAEWSRAQRARLARAGLALETEAYLSLRLVSALCCAVVGVMVGLAIKRVDLQAWAAVAAAFGLFGVDWFVDTRGRANGALLRRQWPHFLHRLRLCLLAGMSLERALSTLADDPDMERGAAFGRQLGEVVREIRAGVSCESALARWGELAQAEEVMALAAAAERSRALGLPLTAGLARQASMARDRLRQEYLGWANGLPARLSLCAMFFFLPAILIVVLLPSVLSFLRSAW